MWAMWNVRLTWQQITHTSAENQCSTRFTARPQTILCRAQPAECCWCNIAAWLYSENHYETLQYYNRKALPVIKNKWPISSSWCISQNIPFSDPYALLLITLLVKESFSHFSHGARKRSRPPVLCVSFKAPFIWPCQASGLSFFFFQSSLKRFHEDVRPEIDPSRLLRCFGDSSHTRRRIHHTACVDRLSHIGL